MTRVSVEVPAELVRPIRETVLLLYQATAESLHQALESRADGHAEVEEAHSHRLRIDELDDLARGSSGGERARQLVELVDPGTVRVRLGRIGLALRACA